MAITIFWGNLVSQRYLSFSKTVFILFVIVVCFLGSCVGKRVPTPPIVELRDIARMEHIAKGTIIEQGPNTTLFIPEGYEVPNSGDIFLTVHFHGVAWFAIEEHARRGAKNPLLVFGGLQGSSAYKEPFLDPTRFAAMLGGVAEWFRDNGAPENTRVNSIEISSFSAGYGAVREILKSPEYVNLIQSLVLADSMYASFAEEGGGSDRSPLYEHVASFIEFARLAEKGEKLFVTTHCQIDTKTYASTADTARFLVKSLGGRFKPVKVKSIPDDDINRIFPLLYRYDKGGLHVWGYAGDTPEAHMAQARTLADFWLAATTGGKPVPVVYGDVITSPPPAPTPTPTQQVNSKSGGLIPPPRRDVPGQRFLLGDKQEVFVPDFYQDDRCDAIPVMVYFHGASWCIEQNFYDAHRNAVLLTINKTDENNFETMGSQLPGLLDHLHKQLVASEITPSDKPLGKIGILSFSGGYTAVRDILKKPELVDRISDVVLADSLYAPRVQGREDLLEPEPLEPFVQYAKTAADGGSSFWFSHLYPPLKEHQNNKSNLAAKYLIEQVGAEKKPASGKNSRGAELLYRADKGNFHILGYSGMTTQDHFEHLYAIADLIRETSFDKID